METNIVAVIVVAIPIFVVTNTDDILVLLGFFSDRRFKTAEILIGQFVGMLTLILLSIIAAAVAGLLPRQYIGFLGLAPVAIGLRKLFDLYHGEDDYDEVIEESGGVGIGNAMSVATVTIANGGDNIGTYTPLFAVHSAIEIVTISTVFLVMTAVWFVIASWMVKHAALGAPIRKYGSRIFPFALIFVGIMIVREAGTFGYFSSIM